MARAYTLTIYLIKTGFPRPDQVLDLEDTEVQVHDLQIQGRDADLYVRPTGEHPPGWLSLFAGAVNLRLLSKNSSAVLLMRVRRRQFALAFGYGRSLIDPSAIEEQFGLKVALNAVGADNIRSIDHFRLDAAQHGRVQASRETPISDFGLDIDQDLLRAVTGVPQDKMLGRRLAGRDALQTTIPITLAELPSLLERLLAQYSRNDYQRDFPWIDHLRKVGNRNVREQLDERIVNKLRTGDLEGMWIAVPEIQDWSRIKCFKYRRSANAPEFPDLHLNDFLAEQPAPALITADDLHRRYAWAISAETDEAMDHWPVYRCLYAEVRDRRDIYILTGGTWYRAAISFVDAVNEAVAAIPESRIGLPPYADANEGAYNERVGGMPNFALLDRQLITYPGGASRIELCDLLSSTREFIHIKRYGASSMLSHLFAQGVVPAELFLQEPEFRRAANELLPTPYRLQDPIARPDSRAYTVVYGIVSGSARPLTLPFFSKVTLRNACRRLTGLGYNVRLAKIPVARAATR